MVAPVLQFLVWIGLKVLVATAYLNSPGAACTQCCCCVVTTYGTRNFCPAVPGWTSSGGYTTSNDTVLVPNCYYLESHPDAVRKYFDDQSIGGGLVDTYSIPGAYVYWRPTDPAYGCFKDLETVTATVAVPTVLPTGKGGTMAAAAPTPNLNVGSGGCIFNGGNLTGIICGNNTNAPIVHSIGGNISVNHTLLIFCAVLALAIVVRGDSAGGCIFNGGNQSGLTCNDNVNINSPPVKSAGFISQLPLRQWSAVMSVLMFIGLVMGNDSAGGCIINGGSQTGFACNNNTNVAPSTATTETHGLSAGEIGGISVACVAAVITLLTAGASFMNPKARVGGKLVWDYRRAAVYRLAEGCTFGFGCGSLDGLKMKVEDLVIKGGLWKEEAS